jgi:hypothetical protein
MELPHTFEDWSQADKDNARRMLAQASGILSVFFRLHPHVENAGKLSAEIDTALGITPVFPKEEA